VLGEPLQGRLEAGGFANDAMQGVRPGDSPIVKIHDPCAAGADRVDGDFPLNLQGVVALVGVAATPKEKIGRRYAEGLASPLEQVQGGVALPPFDEPEMLFRDIELHGQLLLGLAGHGAVELDSCSYERLHTHLPRVPAAPREISSWDRTDFARQRGIGTSAITGSRKIETICNISFYVFF